MAEKMKILLLGHKNHGKDTVCKLLEGHGYTSVSSSQYAFDTFLWPALSAFYDTKEQALADKDNRRALWYELICLYNKDNPARMAVEIFADNDIYNGMRSLDEFNACLEQGLFDLIVWVDASERLPLEDKSSMGITLEHVKSCGVRLVIIDNNGSEAELAYSFLGALAKIQKAPKQLHGNRNRDPYESDGGEWLKGTRSMVPSSDGYGAWYTSVVKGS